MPETFEGITVVADTVTLGQEYSPQVRQALAAAMEASENPDSGLGVPLLDESRMTLVLRYVNDQGLKLATSLANSAGDLGVKSELARATDTYADLQQLADELVGFNQSDFLVEQTQVDPVTGKTRLYVNSLSLDGVKALVEKVDASKVELTPWASKYGLAARNSDNTPYWGGAVIDGCTSGFSWQYGSNVRMLTAGHCYPQGASRNAHTPVAFMGTVYNANGSNWQAGKGTVALISGANTQVRGDFALIEITPSQTGAAEIYQGGHTSSTGRAVVGEWTTSPQQNEQFCTGGANSGEICGWVTTTTTPFDRYYADIKDKVIRVWEGRRGGAPCIVPGDSGGPVYTQYSNGQVQAKGILHGYNSNSDGSCDAVYSAMHDARNLWTGDVLH